MAKQRRIDIIMTGQQLVDEFPALRKFHRPVQSHGKIIVRLRQHVNLPVPLKHMRICQMEVLFQNHPAILPLQAIGTHRMPDHAFVLALQ